MNVQASLSVSDILKRTITTDNRRLQKLAVESFSNWTKLFLVVMTPMAYNLHIAQDLMEKDMTREEYLRQTCP